MILGRRSLLPLTLLLVGLATDAAGQGMGGMGGMGGGGGMPQAPQLERPDFRARVWEEGGPRYGPQSNPPVVDVRIRGNESTPLNTAMALIRTRPERMFDPEVLQGDVKRLLGLFADVKTFTANTPQGIVVTFQVVERPTITYVRFVGNRQVAERALRREAGLKIGDALNKFSIEDARKRLEQYYHTKGYPKAQVETFEGDRPQDKGVVFAISEGTVERILDVEFVGNSIATDARLKTQIQSKPGILWYFFRGKVDRDKIDADVETLTKYYRGLGYFRARVGRELVYSESGRWLNLRFVIDEGPRYVVRNVRIEGNTKFDNDILQTRMQLQSGQFFQLDSMNRDVNSLRDLYGSQGYVYADVKADPRFLEEPGQLDLIYSIEEGEQFTVGSIDVEIKGEHPHTRRSVVLNRLSIRPGDIVDVRQIRASERRLQASQLFETDPSRGSPPQIKIGNPVFPGDEEMVRGQSPRVAPAPRGLPW